jgi:transcriptional regulator with XRE-family HTH domain
MTDADKRAAVKVRALWAAFQKANPGISQEKAAEAAGMGQSAFSQFLVGRVPMRITPVLKFAKLFGVPPAEIREDLGDLPYTAGREPAALKVAEPLPGISEEAIEIARAFDQLQPQSREYIREQVFIYTVIDKSFPWLRHGKPIGKTYTDFENWHQRNIEARRDFEAQEAGRRPRSMKEKKRART